MIRYAMFFFAYLGVRQLVGNSLKNVMTREFGSKGSLYESGIFILGGIYVLRKLKTWERHDLNHLVNAREQPGNFFLSTCQELYPTKVNLELFKQLQTEASLLQPQDSQLHAKLGDSTQHQLLQSWNNPQQSANFAGE